MGVRPAAAARVVAGARKGAAQPRTRTLPRRSDQQTHLAWDATGRPFTFLVAGGDTNDCTQATAVMDATRVPRIGQGRPRARSAHVLGEKGYSSKAIRAWLRRRGIGRHSRTGRPDLQPAPARQPRRTPADLRQATLRTARRDM
ncbi:transposase [Streptomyces decoyicus]|uniref:transposase n=1 Tax=Streptomyces decoyicus TaxID=249567 RepID=UPI0033AED481